MGSLFNPPKPPDPPKMPDYEGIRDSARRDNLKRRKSGRASTVLTGDDKLG